MKVSIDKVVASMKEDDGNLLSLDGITLTLYDMPGVEWLMLAANNSRENRIPIYDG